MNRAFRLRGGDEFQRVWDAGKSWSHSLVVVRVASNGLDLNRFGFVAGKKIGKAVARNRVKRRMREIVRKRVPQMSKGWDIVLIARTAAEKAEFKEIESAVEQVFKRARLLEEGK